jgi:DNA uptake protein ComE-like DNA-binding protein
LILNVGPEEENLRDSSASLDFSTVAKQVVNSPFEGLSVTTPKKNSRMPLEEIKTPTSPFAGRMREFSDSIERHKNKILVLKNESRQKAKEQRNLLKELKATEKENNAKIARSSQEVILIPANSIQLTFFFQKIPSEPAPKTVKSSKKNQKLVDYLNAGENLTRLEGVGPKTAQKIRSSRPIKDFGHFVEIFGETRATKAAVCFVPE